MSRESRTVIISHGSHTIRAGYGIHDTLQRPSVSLTARVGLRRSQLALAKAVGAGEASEAASALKPSDYLVGALLEEALKSERADDPIHVFWPMVGGQIVDWGGVTALWYHVLFFLLPIVRSTNASVTLLSLPPQAITRATSAEIHKIFFEDFNAPAFCLVDSALTSTFAVGQMGACVVDVGWKGSTVSCVLDALTVPASTRTSSVGLGECIAYLAAQLSKDQKIVDALGRLPSASGSAVPLHTLLLELAHEIFACGHVAADGSGPGEDLGRGPSDDDGNFDVLGALTSGKEKEAIAAQEKRNRDLIAAGQEPETEGGATSVAPHTGTDAQGPAAPVDGSNMTDESSDATSVVVSWRDQHFRVQHTILATALTPLSDPSVLSKVDAALLSVQSSPVDSDPPMPAIDWSAAPSLAETIASSLASIHDVERRNPLWELLVVTGAPTKAVKGLAPSIVASLQRFISSSGSDGSGMDPMAGNGIGGAGGFEESGVGGGAGFSNGGVAQPTNLRSLKTPDYFSEFKDRTDLAPFLGSTIYSKLVFADAQARAYTLKATYGEKGPSVAFTVAASER
ncbi:unnamed protein product [Parajaminaea phylloscopi]